MDILNSMKARIAFVFPGQGSQYVGMGKQLYEASPAARRVFEQADATLGFSLSKLCFEGPQAELDDTFNAQPAILTVVVAPQMARLRKKSTRLMATIDLRTALPTARGALGSGETER